MNKKYARVFLVFLTLLQFSIVFSISGQMVYMPDTNFRNELIVQGYSSCIAGDSIDSSCPLVVGTAVLNVSNSNIYDLRGLQAFVNLHKLNCDSNHLSTLPTLPALLDTLFCRKNTITNIPPLPGTLIYLSCCWNQIISLPSLPNGLKILECFINELTALPALPDSLKHLECSYNDITNLPPLPDSLDFLSCHSNQISVLPLLPQ
jgi:Leucine-rich repeat (LRR) protein